MKTTYYRQQQQQQGARRLLYSSAKKLHEDASVIIRAHADYLYEFIDTYGMELDIEIEAKQLDETPSEYRSRFYAALKEVEQQAESIWPNRFDYSI